MDALSELIQFHNLVYLLPMFALAVMMILNRVGLEFDAFGGVDGFDPGKTARWSRRVANAVFPNPDLRGVTLALGGIAWAATGLGLNHLFDKPPFPLFYWTTFAAASLIGWAFGALGTVAIGRALPSEQRRGSMEDFIGQTAVVISETTRGHDGRIRFHDATGNAVTARCRFVVGDPPPRGTRVTLVHYDPETRMFDARP